MDLLNDYTGDFIAPVQAVTRGMKRKRLLKSYRYRTSSENLDLHTGGLLISRCLTLRDKLILLCSSVFFCGELAGVVGDLL